MEPAVTQAKIDSICSDLFLNFTNTGLLSIDLEAVLTKMRPGTAAKTMEYIKARDAELDPSDITGTYSQRLFTALTTIRDNSQNDEKKAERIKMTGTIRPADSMCLFVCGLLVSPSMSFTAWVSSPEDSEAYAYATIFFDYMIEMLGQTITVMQTELETDDAGAQQLALQGIQNDETPVSPSCFICAHNNSPENTQHDNILVLDAFSSPDQFMKYNPAVWHLHCLWLSRADDTMRCYAARTAEASHIFIGNYAEHALLKAKAETPRAEAVLELITKPLEMYRRSLVSLAIQKPAAVISRSHHGGADFNLYMPLVYVHLLVRPDAPLYADVFFNDGLQGMLAYAVGHTQKSLLAQLPFTPDNADPFTCPTPTPAAHDLVTTAHYNLMMTHTFVIPFNAKEHQILFAGGDLARAGTDGHCDYIGAICQVGYNWVFNKTVFQGDCTLPALAANAPYHTIDVHRHICHLQKSQPAGSNLFQTLRTGSHVTASTGTPRTGVVVFDVPAVGHIHQHFNFASADAYTMPDMCKLFAGRHALTDTIKNAMVAYFDPPQPWSLCDMSFKYVMYNAEKDTYFMQDSSRLIVDPAKPVLPATFDACPFCPACYMSRDDAKVQDGSMSAHLATQDAIHIDYPVAALTVAAAAPALPALPAAAVPLLQLAPVPAQDTLIEDAPSGSDRSGGSAHPPAAADPAPLAAPAPAADPKKATQQHLEEMDMLIKQFKFRTSLKEINAVRTQAETSDKNYDTLKKHFDDLLVLVDKQAHESTTVTAGIEDALTALSQQFQIHHDDLSATKKGNLSLADELAGANAQHEENMRLASEQHEEAIEKLMKPYTELQAETLKHEEQLAKLLEQVRKTEQGRLEQNTAFEALTQEMVQKNAEIAALQAEVARLEALVARWKDYADSNIAALNMDINALQQENTLLRAGLPPAPNAAPHDPADAAALLAAQQALLAAEQEVTKYRDYVALLQGEIDALRAQIAAMHQSLQDAAASNRTGFQQLRQEISANVQKQIAVGNLFEKLYPAPPNKPQFTAIRDAVAARANKQQTRYSPAAAFLILESMGGTWHEYRTNEAEALTQTPKTLKERRVLVLEMLLYDLTMWFSMANVPHTRYTSRNVQSFITAFELKTLEVPNDQAASSSDDDAPPPPPAQPETQVQKDARAAAEAAAKALRMAKRKQQQEEVEAAAQAAAAKSDRAYYAAPL